MKSRRETEVEQAVLEAGPGLSAISHGIEATATICSDVLKCCFADAEQLGREPSVLGQIASNKPR
jgi:hypothetical protein